MLDVVALDDMLGPTLVEDTVGVAGHEEKLCFPDPVVDAVETPETGVVGSETG
jgi:hypothetical protein